jgi:hypothetical protein
MTLDDMKPVWAAHGAALSRSLSINERLLRELLVRKARRSMLPYLVWRIVEVATGGVAVGLMAPVVFAHASSPRYLVVGGLAVGFAVAMTALHAYLLVAGSALGYDRPVTELRRDLDRLVLAEVRALKWALLGGILTWLPIALLLLEAFSGLAALGRVPLPWLMANLAFGVVAIVLGHRWSQRVLERRDLPPTTRRIVDALAGRSLRAARAHIAELAAFERS